MAVTPQQEAEIKALLAKGDKLGQAASAQTGVAYNPQYTTYQPQPIAASTSQPAQQPVNVPVYQAPPIPTLDQIQTASNTPSQEVTTAQNDVNQTMQRIAALIGQQGNEAQRKGELETQAGIPDLQKNLNEITAQINAINSSAFQATQNAENRLAPTFSIYGEQAQIARQKSAQTFGLAAAASAMQNNIALAQSHVERALEAEFGAIESRLKFEQLVLDMNRDNLSKAEQKQAQRFQLQLEERNRLLSEQKAEKEGIYSLINRISQYGTPPEVINRLLSAKTYDEAIRMASPYLQSPEAQLALQSAKLDLQYRKNQIYLQSMQISQGNQQTQQIGTDLISILGSNRLGQTTKTNIGTVMGVINAAEALAKARPTGEFKGFNFFSGLTNAITPDSIKSKNTSENESYLAGINLKVQQWASGAHLSEQQIEQVNKMIPTKWDSDRKVREKLNNLVNVMQTQIQGQLAGEGIDYQPQTVDLFSDDTLDSIFNQPDWSAYKPM